MALKGVEIAGKLANGVRGAAESIVAPPEIKSGPRRVRGELRLIGRREARKRERREIPFTGADGGEA
jgi:hypothetical protein